METLAWLKTLIEFPFFSLCGIVCCQGSNSSDSLHTPFFALETRQYEFVQKSL
jgi:hypothetical protein